MISLIGIRWARIDSIVTLFFLGAWGDYTLVNMCRFKHEDLRESSRKELKLDLGGLHIYLIFYVRICVLGSPPLGFVTSWTDGTIERSLCILNFSIAVCCNYSCCKRAIVPLILQATRMGTHYYNMPLAPLKESCQEVLNCRGNCLSLESSPAFISRNRDYSRSIDYFLPPLEA